MVKNFVLDTNILLHCPEAVYKFEDNNLYIPHVVLEELDNHKEDRGETGYNARETIRILKHLREGGKLLNGVRTPGGGKLYEFISETLSDSVPAGWERNKPDNLILMSAMELAAELPDVYIITNDGGMQLKADALDLPFQEYRNDRVSKKNASYTGREEVYLDTRDFNTLLEKKEVDASAIYCVEKTDIFQNQFLVVKNGEGGSILAKYDNGMVRLLEYSHISAFSNLHPRNAGQTFLQEALFGDSPLVICDGPAGTGKTLFALGAGLCQVMDDNPQYSRVLICRPNVTMDEEIGFLPGTEFEKISPLLRGCYDNLEILLKDRTDTPDLIQDKIDEIFEHDYITAEAIAYLRGRSITDTFIIIDEAQNATPNQILSIITRAGERSKIVLLGDPDQIDNPRLDRYNNGLTFAKDRMKSRNGYFGGKYVNDKGKDVCTIVSFTENECSRSLLAKVASERLKR